MVKLFKSLFKALFAKRLIKCQRCGHEYLDSYNGCPMANCGVSKLMKFAGNSHDRRVQLRRFLRLSVIRP